VFRFRKFEDRLMVAFGAVAILSVIAAVILVVL
jgi:hypothetical protein